MSRNYKILILVLIILISLAGGVVGGILVRAYFLNSSFNVPLFGDINLASQYQGGSLVISQPGRVIVEQDERVYGVIQDVNKSVVNFYKKKTGFQNGANGAEVKNWAEAVKGYYAKDEALAQGLVLTSDGWIITKANLAPMATNFIAIDNEGKMFDIEETVFDKATGYYFIKIAADGLAAAQFNEKGDITDGQTIIGIYKGISDIAYVQKARFDAAPGSVKSTESYYSRIKINKDTLDAGSIIAGLDGQITGLYEKDGLITPMHQLAGLLSGLLSEQKIIRPVLGLYYINMYHLTGKDKLEGVLISKNANGASVVKNTSAEKAGLAFGDVIIEVDGRKLDENNTLSEVVLERKPGDNLDLTVIRGAEKKNIKVVLE